MIVEKAEILKSIVATKKIMFPLGLASFGAPCLQILENRLKKKHQILHDRKNSVLPQGSTLGSKSKTKKMLV